MYIVKIYKKCFFDDFMMKFEFDPEISVSWGHYLCEKCNSKFYDRRNPVHLDGCTGSDNGNVVYHFGRKEAVAVLDAGRSVYSSLKTQDLEANFPDLVVELRADSQNRKR